MISYIFLFFLSFKEITCEKVKIIDGDTIKCYYFENGEIIRLYGIDTFEIRKNKKFKKDIEKLKIPETTYFELAEKGKKYLEDFLFLCYKIDIRILQEDKYKRKIGQVFCNILLKEKNNYSFIKIDLNEFLIKSGYACKRYDKLNIYKNITNKNHLCDLLNK